MSDASILAFLKTTLFLFGQIFQIMKPKRIFHLMHRSLPKFFLLFNVNQTLMSEMKKSFPIGRIHKHFPQIGNQQTISDNVKNWLIPLLTSRASRIAGGINEHLGCNGSDLSATGGVDAQECGTSKRGYHTPTRFTKMDMSQFSHEDVVGWIFKCDSYFDLDKTLDRHKVTLVNLMLDKMCYLWFDGFKKRVNGPIS